MFIICDLNEWNNYLKIICGYTLFIYFILFFLSLPLTLYDRRIYVSMCLIARSMKDGSCMSAFTAQLMMKTCDLNAIT
jgi:hypothetical protein